MTRAGRRFHRRPGSAILAACLSLMAAGCVTSADRATLVRQPSTAPVKTISNFTESLRCMDVLLWNHGKRDIFMTSNGLPDATGRVAGGTKEMLITAVSRMSTRSNAFRFVDFEPALDDVNALYSLIGIQPDFRVPSYYVRGAITQLDDNVIDESVGAGISLPQVDLGVSADQRVSVISVDLNVGDLVTRQIIPGMSASNSIAVKSSGVGADAGGTINKAGLSFNVALNQSEGFHQAVRTLVELSTIEVLGKLTRVPYWQCLGIEHTNSAFMAQAREWFDTMSTTERVAFVQRVLQADRYYDGPISGTLDGATQSAVGRYQSDNDLIATGRIDFDTYYRMLGKPAAQAMSQDRGDRLPGADGRPRVEQTAAPVPSIPEVILTTDRGPSPSYRVGETVVFQAQTTADGFLYCFYMDNDGSVSRIFPNRFQPDAFIEGNRQIEIPPGYKKPFNIRMDRAGNNEAVACVVSGEELGTRLPDRFKTEDLQTIPQARLTDVLNAFATIPGKTVRSKQMPINVLPAAQS
jgi:curli biogenesis system outer membrane secretion channel CsgG/peptidoglycan hydrolase-like protein with peptidoglycan-binding domain